MLTNLAVLPTAAFEGLLILLNVSMHLDDVLRRFAPRFFETMAKLGWFLEELSAFVPGWGIREKFL